MTGVDIMDQLLDALSADEVQLIMTTLDAHQRELAKRSRETKLFVDQYVGESESERRQLYAAMITDDQGRADAINALLTKLRA